MPSVRRNRGRKHGVNAAAMSSTPQVGATRPKPLTRPASRQSNHCRRTFKAPRQCKQRQERLERKLKEDRCPPQRRGAEFVFQREVIEISLVSSRYMCEVRNAVS
jgi:hypothetical protein